MAVTINYASKYSNKVDERFALEAKSDKCVNQDYDFVGAQTVKVYSINTTTMNDYKREGLNRYGAPEELGNSVQELTMAKDRAFTFTIDKMVEDETAGAHEAGKALARQLSEIVIPEVDTYRFTKMITGAGTTATAVAITDANIEGLIYDATNALDEAKVPQTGRFIVVTPATYKAMKQSKAIVLDTEVGQEMKLRGVVSIFDGMEVIKVPASLLPDKTGFLVGHNIACTAPVKLAEYKIHDNVPGISGKLVEGRVYYDAFVLNNKKKALYAQPIA